MRSFIFASLLLLAACGPEEAHAAPPTPGPLAPADTGVARVATEFAGKWIERKTSQKMITTVNANLLSVSGMCADGTGVLNVIGRDRVINWTGDLLCPAPAGSCSAGVLHYSSAILTLTDNNTLDVSGQGYMSGCSETARTPFAFHYVRQVDNGH